MRIFLIISYILYFECHSKIETYNISNLFKNLVNCFINIEYNSNIMKFAASKGISLKEYDHKDQLSFQKKGVEETSNLQQFL